MALLHSCYKRWRARRAAAQRIHQQEEVRRSHLVLGAYGLDFYPEPEPSTLNDSLVVSWLTSEKPGVHVTAA